MAILIINFIIAVIFLILISMVVHTFHHKEVNGETDQDQKPWEKGNDFVFEKYRDGH